MEINHNSGINVFGLLYSGFAIFINALLSIQGGDISQVIAWLVGISAIAKNVYDIYHKRKNKV